MSKAKILLYDLETSPNIGYTWSKWETNVIRFVKEWGILSVAWKWLGSSGVECVSQKTCSEREVVGVLHDLMGKADITVAHNGDGFDLKKARTKFLQFGLKPPALSRSVDTKKIARSQFSFNSNSLNDLGETLGLGKKMETGGFDLWLGCMSGNKASWDKMIKYNKQDVILLEKVYNKLKTWAPSHPSLAALEGKTGCPTCGSTRVHSNGFRATTKRLQQRWRCNDCGHNYTGKVDHATKT